MSRTSGRQPRCRRITAVPGHLNHEEWHDLHMGGVRATRFVRLRAYASIFASLPGVDLTTRINRERERESLDAVSHETLFSGSALQLWRFSVRACGPTAKSPQGKAAQLRVWCSTHRLTRWGRLANTWALRTWWNEEDRRARIRRKTWRRGLTLDRFQPASNNGVRFSNISKYL